jgi:hypothetical protein
VLRIPVDGEWQANEWAEFLNAMDGFYSKLAVLEIAKQLVMRETEPRSEDAQLSNRVGRLIALVTDPSRSSQDFLKEDDFRFERQLEIEIPPVLLVIALRYGSEGFTDFLGHGESLKAICGSFNKLIDYFANRKKRKIGIQIQNMNLINLKVEQYEKTGATPKEVAQYRLALLKDSDPVLRKQIRNGKLPDKAKMLPPPPNYPLLPPPAKKEP